VGSESRTRAIRSMLFRSLGVALLCSPSAAFGGPDAAPHRLELVRAEGAAVCAPAAAVARDVVARLGRDPFAADGERAFEVVLSRSESTWQAMIYLRVDGAEDDAVRLIESDAPDCEELVKSVALAIALAIAPDAPAPRPPAPPPPPPPPPRVPVAAREAPAPKLPPVTPLHAGFSLRALASPNLPQPPAIANSRRRGGRDDPSGAAGG